MEKETFLDHPDIRWVLFHPRPEDNPDAVPPGVRRVAVEVEPGLFVGGRLYPAHPDSPALLFFHGNGEIAADYDDLAGFYTRMGISLLVADYRGYGTSGGTPSARYLLADAVAVFDALPPLLASHGLSPERLYVMGRSLGSAAALEVAVHAGERLAGLVIESGLASTFALLARLGLRVSGADEERDGMGNLDKIARVTVPTLIIHGQNDVLIPAADGQALYERSGAVVKSLVLIPGAGHNDLLWAIGGRQRYFDAIRALIHRGVP